MKPSDFFRVSKLLLDSDGAEPAQRSSVSRAYYGVLHACRSALPLTHAPTKDQLRAAGSHKATIEAMQRWGASDSVGRAEAQKVARALVQLKRHRVWADYELDAKWDVNAKKVLDDSIAAADLAFIARKSFDAAAR